LESIRKIPFNKPFFLSGGIGIEEIQSVKELLKTDLPIHAIDINSKFEIEPGLKNIQLLKDFKINKMSYHVNEKGFYGEFGGAFIPEMLYPNVKNYVKSI
jgi:phosphoribosylanthranilate isomerase